MSDWEDETGPVAAQAPRHNYGDRIYRPTGGGRGFDRSGGDQRSNRGNNSSYQQNEGNKKVISVPSHKVGRIIGKGGSKIRDLEFESEAKIKIGDSNGNNTDVTLIGTDDAVHKVESMIYKLIEDRRPPRDDFNQSTSGNRDQRSSRGGGNNYQQSEGNKKVISVPSHKVGRIIGKGGSKIRDLEYESEAKIKIGDSNGNNTDVTLIGTDDAVIKVEGMIFKLLEDRRQGEDYNQGTSGSGISDLMKTNENGRQVVDWEKVREKSKDW